MAQIDFPAGHPLGKDYNAPNGVIYVKVEENPDVWLVKQTAVNVAQRLWAKDFTTNSIFPVYAGDDVKVITTNGKETTTITSGPTPTEPTRKAGIKSDNYSFWHLSALP